MQSKGVCGSGDVKVAVIYHPRLMYDLNTNMILFSGSGKTAAFLLPILSRINEEGGALQVRFYKHFKEFKNCT